MAEDLSASGLEGGGNMRLGRQFGEFKAGFKVDTKAVKDLDRSFKDLHNTLSQVKKDLQDISALSKGLKVNLGSAGGAASGNQTSGKIAQMSNAGGSGGADDAVAASARNGIFQKIKGSVAGGGGGAGGGAAAAGKAGIAGAIAGPLMAIAGAAGSSLNERIARGYEYSLAADKMNLRIQQMTGMSALDVQAQYRQPLTNYRLGQGGINDVLALQRNTGLGNQGAAIDALRTSSGFGYSTADVTRMIQTMASPQSNNRMFLMTGMSMYGIGGKENSAMDVIQNATRRLNLTNPAVAKGARQQGSNTRQMMEFMGIPQDMQEMILDYGEQQVSFQKKGGKGMYDPANRQHQQMMGVSDSFALQREETDRVKTSREEDFYRRQVDNFADLEKKTQSLTEMFGKLEDKLSGIIGESISNKPFLSAGKSLLSGGLVAGGAALSTTGYGALLGVPMMLAGLGLQMFGDPYDNPASASDSNIKIPTYGKPTTISSLESNSTFSKMHPKMKDRLKKLFIASGGRVGFGGGTRDPAQQRQLFLSRYTPTSEKTGIEWDGKYWKKNPGVAAAAPPGRSMHEIGLAADLVGDMDWLAKNAGRFGLKTFGDVNDEPWHVQPTELPNSRREYEKGGATWGTNGQFDETARFDGPGAPPSDDSGHAGSGGKGFVGEGAFNTTPVSGSMTINDAIEVARSSQMASFLAGGGGDSSYGGGSYVPRGGTTTTKALSGKMSGKEIVSLMSSVGRWSGQDLVKAVGISYRESSWNPRTLNPNRKTKDKSYGLFQINMIDSLGPSRRKWFGIATDEQLYDPTTNVRSARMMYDSRAATKGNGWYDWGPYKNMPETYKVDMAAAAQTVREANMGDPMDTPRGGRMSYGTSVYNEGSTVSVPVNVYLQGSGYAAKDAHMIANEVARILEDKAQILSIRRS